VKRFLAAALICAVFLSCKTPPLGKQDEDLPPAAADTADAETDVPAVEEEGIPPDTGTEDTGEPALEEAAPSVEDFAETPSEEFMEEPVELPVPDMPPMEVPRVITFLDPPPEKVTDQDYPEPEPPGLSSPLDLSRIPEESSGPPAPPEPQSEPAPSEPAPSVLAEKPPPEPPPPALVEEPPPELPPPALAEEPPSEPPPSVLTEEPPPTAVAVSLPKPAPLPEPSPPPAPVPPLIRPAESARARPSPRETLPVPVNSLPDPPARQPPVTGRSVPPEPVPSVQPLAPPAVPKRVEPAITPVPASPKNEDALSYSRTIRGTTGQVLEVPFQGTGWVYLGGTNAAQGVSYLSRRAETGGQTFMFRLDESGEYELRFYKQDFIRDHILNDHVRIIVKNAPEWNSFFYPDESAKLVAELRWPPSESPAGQTNSDDASPPAVAHDGQSPETVTAGQDNASPETVTAGQDNVSPETLAAGQDNTTPETPAELLPAALLGRAREAYEAEHFPEALAALDEFCSNFPLGNDEAWWLYGQVLESPGSRRDIRGALEYYRRLVREYPQSPRCNDAGKRIAYLERFYFNIR
jgi:hypothetical protein